LKDGCNNPTLGVFVGKISLQLCQRTETYQTTGHQLACQRGKRVSRFPGQDLVIARAA
jgi:hypothetical protein